jgi:hypothetical protein
MQESELDVVSVDSFATPILIALAGPADPSATPKDTPNG